MTEQLNWTEEMEAKFPFPIYLKVLPGVTHILTEVIIQRKLQHYSKNSGNNLFILIIIIIITIKVD